MSLKLGIFLFKFWGGLHHGFLSIYVTILYEQAVIAVTGSSGGRIYDLQGIKYNGNNLSTAPSTDIFIDYNPPNTVMRQKEI